MRLEDRGLALDAGRPKADGAVLGARSDAVGVGGVRHGVHGSLRSHSCIGGECESGEVNRGLSVRVERERGAKVNRKESDGRVPYVVRTDGVPLRGGGKKKCARRGSGHGGLFVPGDATEGDMA